MARLLKKKTIYHVYLTRSFSSFESTYKRERVLQHYQDRSLRHFCSSIKPEKRLWEEKSHDILLRKLEISLKDHQVNEAWTSYHDFKSLHGFPDHSLMNRFIIELSYSFDPKWLQKASDLVFLIDREKSNLLRADSLTKLSLSLARAQMPLPSSNLLRLMLHKDYLLLVNMFGSIVLHMVKTEIGAYLASNILIELFVSKKPSCQNPIKPDTMIFNLVLDACLRFKSCFKGQQIIELMAKVGVVADAHTIVIISQIYEMNGQRDDLKNFKDHVDRASIHLVSHYRQFYDSLLSLHLKFNDADAASELILDIHGCRESLPVHQTREDHKPLLVPIGSPNLKSGLKLQALPKLLHKDSVLNNGGKHDLVLIKNRKLIISNRTLAKIITMYRRSGRISDLSKILSILEKNVGIFEENGLCSDVIDACVHLNWLETAHDILEDSESDGISVRTSSYSLLLSAYYRENMFRQAEALLKQIRKSGLKMNDSGNAVISGLSELAKSLIWESKEEEKTGSYVVNEINSSIYFFMKAKMVGDAMKTYRKMQEMNLQANLSTFQILAHGFSSMKMYREITILWGDIKRSNLAVLNRDFYEFLLLNFIWGGYFERVMEIVGCMEERSMFMDKWMYKNEYLKFHKGLYRKLRSSDARSEAQSKRIEHVRGFRKWLGIH